MVLMIFVNDLGSLKNIPVWLEHVPSGVDGIGLADVVFPAFLFIVGLALPFAVDHRRKKGDSTLQLVGHIAGRSIALLVMGVFLVNGESVNEEATGLTRLVWNVLCCTSFILIWNAYGKTVPHGLSTGLKTGGVVILLVLAISYRGEGDAPARFATHWWGILGLIGWSYFASALVTVFARHRLYFLLAAWIGFCLLSMAAKADLLPEFTRALPGPIRDGTLPGLSLGGVVIGTLFRRYKQQANSKGMTLVFVTIAALLVGLSVYTRPFWGLAKLGATPAWLFLSSALTILTFTVIYWLADVRKKGNWFSLIKPAGTDTLLCYLMPYFAYAGIALVNLELPDAFLTGGVGLFKSFLFALVCVWVAGKLSRAGVRLKL